MRIDVGIVKGIAARIGRVNDDGLKRRLGALPGPDLRRLERMPDGDLKLLYRNWLRKTRH